MKKTFVIVLYFIFLSAISFGGGILVAERKIGGTSQKILENQNIAENQEEKNNDTSNLSTEENIEAVSGENPEAKPVEPEPESKEVKFSFAILGDTQYFKPGVLGSYQTAVNNIKKINPELVFSAGDLVSSCDGGSECEAKFNDWKNVLGEFSSKTYPAQGNHDRTGEDRADAIWQKVFNLPANGPVGYSELTYSFDYRNSHFVVLSSDKPEENIINDIQRDWLDKNLSASKKENTFVFFHEPAYPTNSKIGESLDVNAKDRDALWNILTSHKVTAVFSGHEHIQSRRKINGLYQFIFGNTESFNHLAPKPGTAEYFYVGQAFGIVEIEGKNITVKTYSIKGNILNSFILSK